MRASLICTILALAHANNYHMHTAASAAQHAPQEHAMMMQPQIMQPQVMQPQSYDAPQSVQAPEPYHEPEEPHDDEGPICLKVCPLDFPMLNPQTGVCSARPEPVPEPEEPAYEPHQMYMPARHFAQAAYRKLMGYGAQTRAEPPQGAQESYAAAQQVAQEPYAQAVQEPYEEELIDTSCGAVSRSGRITLWVTFVILFLAAMFFLKRYHYYSCCGDKCEELHLNERYSCILHFLSPVAVLEGVICLIAALAYLCMALGNGFYVTCAGRIFLYVRYIDWLITTPLLLNILLHFANASFDVWICIIFADVIMIVGGLIGGTIVYRAKWGFFALAFLAFIPILFYLCRLREQTCDNREYWAECGLLVKECDYGKDGTCHLPYLFFFHHYPRFVNLVAIVWFIYPIIWICAEGTGVLCVDGEIIAYAVLDIITKVIFGLLAVHADPICREECAKRCKCLIEFYGDKYDYKDDYPKGDYPKGDYPKDNHSKD